jgi:Trk K+ transport system NAD-binding subunit
MTLTPRQIAAYLEFSGKLDRIERADALMIAAIGAQGDSKVIEKTLKELNGGKD